MTIARSVYVISDLHIGGSYEDPNAKHEQRRRGFRMMTHVQELAEFVDVLAALPATPIVELVINGDFIDFLAEEYGAGIAIDATKPPAWSPFRANPGEALAAFREIVKRDKILFESLAKFVAKPGKCLTLVLGNHDIELCIPDVRAELMATLGGGIGDKVRFLDDGQALDLGEVLVDHGNVFDPANVVDHDQLRVLRSAYSRGWFKGLDRLFTPPAGSKLVADVMNPIKIAYGFIDLLKPESEPLFALLLALEPRYRREIDDCAVALTSIGRSLVPRAGLPNGLRNISAPAEAAQATSGLRSVSSSTAPKPSAVNDLVDELLPAAVAASLKLEGNDAVSTARTVSDGSWTAKWSLFRLLTGRDDGELDLDRRIPQVQATLAVLARDRSFDRAYENTRYLDAAKMLVTSQGKLQKGYKAVVFGHTHHAKAMSIPDTKSQYFNTGTWANLMQFPKLFTDLTATPAEVKAELFAFAKQLEANELGDHIKFTPTYVQIDLDEKGGLDTIRLRDYDHVNKKLV